MYLQVELPALTGGTQAWIEYIGHHMIKEIEIEVGGARIDRHYGQWLHIWSELTLTASREANYKKMVGQVSTLTAQNAGTIAAYTLYVPCKFWFCDNAGLALPLIALQLTLIADKSITLVGKIRMTTNKRFNGLRNSLKLKKSIDTSMIIATCSRCKNEFKTEKYKTCEKCRTEAKKYRENTPRKYKQGVLSSLDGVIKTCNKCLLPKNTSLFYKNVRYKDGYVSSCKDCHSLLWKTYYNKTYKSVLSTKGKTDEIYKLKQTVKSYIHSQLKIKGLRKIDSTMKYIGCSIHELREWIMFQCKDYDSSKYQIDHVIPLSSFNLLNKNEIEIAFHWTNIQILSNSDNLKKYTKFIEIDYFNHLLKTYRYINNNSQDFSYLKRNFQYIKNKSCNTSKLRETP